LSDQDLRATNEAKDVAIDLLSRAKLRPNFGNGGEVENMLSLAKTRCQKRLALVPASERANIVFIPDDFDPNYNRDKSASDNLEKLFEGVVGCEDVVQKLGNYQKVARNLKARGMDMRSQIPTSFIFKGPPGE
jgi:AAA lid domain